MQFLPRWQPNGEPLYHRRLGAQWHDMCAESLGMPKVALCFLTRGPVHQVTTSCATVHDESSYYRVVSRHGPYLLLADLSAICNLLPPIDCIPIATDTGR